MEGLIFFIAGSLLGWQISYAYWRKKIRSEESSRVMNRVLNLESALRWEKARAEGFLEDIKRRYDRKG